MGYYMIGIGGTGARCLEALIHLAAAGLIDESVNIIFVDSDSTNGNLNRAKETLQFYKEARQSLVNELSQPDLSLLNLLNPSLETFTPEVWTPFNDEAKPSIQKLFSYDSLSDRDRGLLDILYTEKDRDISLKQGFLGRPSVGAAALTNNLELEKQEPWKTFCGKISTDQQAKVMVVGSIFGGTGAAGLPTIASLLSKRFEKQRANLFRLGGTLMLPYFSFPPADDRDKLQSDADQFVIKSKAALNYYQTKLDIDRIYKAIYLLGCEEQAHVNNHSLGNRDQCNPSHFVELYAATAARHFFSQAMDDPAKSYIVAREPGSTIGWNSISDGEDFKYKLASLAKFSYAYLGYFYPRIKNPQNFAKEGVNRATWYVNFIRREGLENIQDTQNSGFDYIAKYCESFLKWLDDLHSFNNQIKLNLFDTTTYCVERDDKKKAVGFSIPHDRYGSLYTGGQSSANKVTNFQDLVKKLAARNRIDSQKAQRISLFVRALYQECQVN